MKVIYIESKDKQEVINQFYEIKPEVWRTYIKTDYETLKEIYGIECYVVEAKVE